MAAMVVVMAIPAFAAANPHASCQGAVHSNQTEPGAAGDLHSSLGQSGFNGDVSKDLAQLGPQGKDRNTTGELGPNFVQCGTP